MGSNFPVPSKGALRVLRQIVYASSFGTAAAVFLEEPRRQICNARKVLENKRKLQAARGYASAAALAERAGQGDELTYWGRHLRSKGRADFQDFPCNDPVLPSDVDVGAVRDYVTSSSRSRTCVLPLGVEEEGKTKHPSRKDADLPFSHTMHPGCSVRTTPNRHGAQTSHSNSVVWADFRKHEQWEDIRTANQRFTRLVERLATPFTSQHAEDEYLNEAVKALRYCVYESAMSTLPVQEAAQNLLAFVRNRDPTAPMVCELEGIVGGLCRQRTYAPQQDACAKGILGHLSSGDNDRAITSLIDYVQAADASIQSRHEIFGGTMLGAVHHLLGLLECHGNIKGLKEVRHLVGPYFPEIDLSNLIKRNLDAGRPELAFELLYVRHARDPQDIGPILLNSTVLILDCLRSALNRTAWPAGELKSLFEELHRWYLQFDSNQDLLQKDLQLLVDMRRFDNAVDLLTSTLPVDVDTHCTPETLAIAFELQLWYHGAPLSTWVRKICHWMEMRKDVINPQRRELRRRAKARLVQSCRESLKGRGIKAALGSLRCLAALGLQPNDSVVSPLLREVLDSPTILEDLDSLHQLHAWAIVYGFVDEEYVDAVLRCARGQLSKRSLRTAADVFYSLASFEVDYEDDESEYHGHQTYANYPALLSKASELAADLFDAAIRSGYTGSTTPATCIFRWMMTAGISTVSHLCELIGAHNAQGEYDQIVDIYSTHLTEERGLPRDVRKKICMAFAAVGPADQTFQLLESEWHHGLQAEPRAFIRLLERTWKSTRSVQQVKQKLLEMQAWMGPDAYNTALYNCVIGICVKARKSEEAQHFLELLQKDSKLNVITYGHCMFDKAIAGDWANVKILLQQATESGVTDDLRWTGCGAFFNRVFDVFRQSHDAQETFEFLKEAIDLYCVTPDQTTSDIAIESFMLNQQLQLVPELIEYLNERGYGLQLSEVSFTYVFRKYYHMFQPSHKVLQRLYNGIRTLKKDWVMPGVLDLIRNAVSCASQDPKGSKHNLAVREETIKRLEQGATNSSLKAKAQHIQSSMIRAMSSLQTGETVRIYKDSLIDGLPLSATHLEIAVEASIRAKNGSLEEAYALVSDAQAAGMDTTKAYAPLLHHRIANGDLSDTDITASILGFYKALDERGLRPRHFIAVSAAHKLLMTRRPGAAISLLTAVASSKWGLQKPLDIAAMSVFVRAYATTTNIEGINWAVKHVLSTKLRVDEKFIVHVSRASGPFRRLAVRANLDAKTVRACKASIQQLTEWLKMCRARKEQQRKDALRVGREIVELGRFVKDAGDVNEAVDMFMWHGNGSVSKAERPVGGKWVGGGKEGEGAAGGCEGAVDFVDG